MNSVNKLFDTVDKKSDLFDYIKWRGDLDFGTVPFCEVDALCFSILAYLDYSEVTKDGACVGFSETIQLVLKNTELQRRVVPGAILNSILALATYAAESERYGKLGVFGFESETDEEKQMQFAAVCFELSKDEVCVAYRGTDYSLVGIKEDLNMSFLDNTPAQCRALSYLGNHIERYSAVTAVGHSKGGNLAVWSAVHLPVEKKPRIKAIYNNDGPGFCNNLVTTEAYTSISDRIYSFVPQSSIIGVLMEHDKNYRNVSSFQTNVLQHDPFSWRVEGKHFVYADNRSLFGRQVDALLNEWIRSMNETERQELVEVMYSVMSSSDCKTLDDMDRAKLKTLWAMQKTLWKLDRKSQKHLLEGLSKLTRTVTSSLIPNKVTGFFNRLTASDDNAVLPEVESDDDK